MATMTVYGTPASTYVRTARLLLEESGVDYELKSVDIFSGENQSAEYLAKHPFGKVPTLDADGDILYETSAITDYVNTVFANGKFTPSNPLTRARMHQIMAIVDNYLYPTVIGTIVIQRLIVPSKGGETDEDKVARAVEPAKTAAEAIESLAVCNPYLLGNEISLADFYLIPVFVYASKMPEFAAITAETPKLLDWWQRVSELPVVQKVCG